jgi:AraC-like DNA-binding protein
VITPIASTRAVQYNRCVGRPTRDLRAAGGIWYITATCPRFPLERHDELELHLVVNGTGSVVCGSREYALGRGTLVWLLPGHWHAITSASPDLALWVGMFSPDLVEEARALDSGIAQGSAAECIRVSTEELAALSEQCFRLLRLRRSREAFEHALGALLVRAWHARETTLDREPEIHQAVSRAAELLTHAHQPMPLHELAKRAGLSPFHLSRAFHARMGVTLAHYANHQRVQRFECLFGEGNERNLLEAALDAGFGSYSQFFRVYTLVSGSSPHVHRERIARHIAPRERWASPLGAGVR